MSQHNARNGGQADPPASLRRRQNNRLTVVTPPRVTPENASWRVKWLPCFDANPVADVGRLIQSALESVGAALRPDIPSDPDELRNALRKFSERHKKELEVEKSPDLEQLALAKEARDVSGDLDAALTHYLAAYGIAREEAQRGNPGYGGWYGLRSDLGMLLYLIPSIANSIGGQATTTPQEKAYLATAVYLVSTAMPPLAALANTVSFNFLVPLADLHYSLKPNVASKLSLPLPGEQAKLAGELIRDVKRAIAANRVVPPGAKPEVREKQREALVKYRNELRRLQQIIDECDALSAALGAGTSIQGLIKLTAFVASVVAGVVAYHAENVPALYPILQSIIVIAYMVAVYFAARKDEDRKTGIDRGYFRLNMLSETIDDAYDYALRTTGDPDSCGKNVPKKAFNTMLDVRGQQVKDNLQTMVRECGIKLADMVKIGPDEWQALTEFKEKSPEELKQLAPKDRDAYEAASEKHLLLSGHVEDYVRNAKPKTRDKYNALRKEIDDLKADIKHVDQRSYHLVSEKRLKMVYVSMQVTKSRPESKVSPDKRPLKDMIRLSPEIYTTYKYTFPNRMSRPEDTMGPFIQNLGQQQALIWGGPHGPANLNFLVNMAIAWMKAGNPEALAAVGEKNIKQIAWIVPAAILGVGAMSAWPLNSTSSREWTRVVDWLSTLNIFGGTQGQMTTEVYSRRRLHLRAAQQRRAAASDFIDRLGARGMLSGTAFKEILTKVWPFIFALPVDGANAHKVNRLYKQMASLFEQVDGILDAIDKHTASRITEIDDEEEKDAEETQAEEAGETEAGHEVNRLMSGGLPPQGGRNAFMRQWSNDRSITVTGAEHAGNDEEASERSSTPSSAGTITQQTLTGNASGTEAAATVSISRSGNPKQRPLQPPSASLDGTRVAGPAATEAKKRGQAAIVPPDESSSERVPAAPNVDGRPMLRRKQRMNFAGLRRADASGSRATAERAGVATTATTEAGTANPVAPATTNAGPSGANRRMSPDFLYSAYMSAQRDESSASEPAQSSDAAASTSGQKLRMRDRAQARLKKLSASMQRALPKVRFLGSVDKGKGREEASQQETHSSHTAAATGAPSGKNKGDKWREKLGMKKGMEKVKKATRDGMHMASKVLSVFPDI